MSVAAFATEPGDTVKIPVTVNGPVGNFKIQVSGTDVLSVVEIHKQDGMVVNAEKGIVAWAAAENYDSFTFYVTVKVADDAAVGTHYLNVEVKDAAMKVGVENDTDGVADGWMKTSTTASGYVKIEEPETEPTTEEPTEEPTEKPTEKPTEAPTEEPTEKPTEKPTEAPTQKPTEAPTQKPTEGEKDDVPETGDISTQVYMTGALVLVLMAAAVALVTKRRSVK